MSSQTHLEMCPKLWSEPKSSSVGMKTSNCQLQGLSSLWLCNRGILSGESQPVNGQLRIPERTPGDPYSDAADHRSVSLPAPSLSGRQVLVAPGCLFRSVSPSASSIGRGLCRESLDITGLLCTSFTGITVLCALCQVPGNMSHGFLRFLVT